MKEFFEKHIVWFIFYAVIVSGIAFYIMSRADGNLKESHKAIIANQEKSAVLVDSLLNLRNILATDSVKHQPMHLQRLCDRLDDAIATLDAHQNNSRVVSLLELEYTKIQSEYEILNLWCALLTVVFLIFSFFSIFKTNEMSNQSEAALAGMRQTELDIKKKSDEIDKEIGNANTKIATLKTTLTSLEGQKNQLSSSITTLKNDHGKLSKDIQSESDKISDIQKKEETIHASLDEELNTKKQQLSDQAAMHIKNFEELVPKMAKQACDIVNKEQLDRISALEKDLKLMHKDIAQLLSAQEEKEAQEEKPQSEGDHEEIEDPEDPEEGLHDEDDQETPIID